MTWHDRTGQDRTWHDMTCHDMTWYEMRWDEMRWDDMTWYVSQVLPRWYTHDALDRPITGWIYIVWYPGTHAWICIFMYTISYACTQCILRSILHHRHCSILYKRWYCIRIVNIFLGSIQWSVRYSRGIFATHEVYSLLMKYWLLMINEVYSWDETKQNKQTNKNKTNTHHTQQ